MARNPLLAEAERRIQALKPIRPPASEVIAELEERDGVTVLERLWQLAIHSDDDKIASANLHKLLEYLYPKRGNFTLNDLSMDEIRAEVGRRTIQLRKERLAEGET